MTSHALAIAMAAMLAPRHPGPIEIAHLRIVAAQILLRAPARGVDPMLVAAVMGHESGFDQRARGDAGEIGLGQLKRGTAATRGYDDASDAVLESVPVNVMLTVRHLAHIRGKCGGPPVAWISAYSGRRCRPSGYSRAILASYATGRAAIDALEVAASP